MSESIAVRVGQQLIRCRPAADGVYELPVAAGIDFEVTGLLVDMLTGLGHSPEEIETALNGLRVEYVMGRRQYA